MTTKTDYNKTLDKLAELLRRKPMTARAISEALTCCRPAAYQRLRALQERGDAVFEMQAPELPKGSRKPGPRSIAYGIR